MNTFQEKLSCRLSYEFQILGNSRNGRQHAGKQGIVIKGEYRQVLRNAAGACLGIHNGAQSCDIVGENNSGGRSGRIYQGTEGMTAVLQHLAGDMSRYAGTGNGYGKAAFPEGLLYASDPLRYRIGMIYGVPMTATC